MKLYLLWIWLACGAGLLFMGTSSSWDDRAFRIPNDSQLRSYTGILEKVVYSAPAKSPALIELTVYQKKEGMKYAYLRYGLHEWEERLKPYLHQNVTLLTGIHQQVWGINVGRKLVLSAIEIEKRLQGMKQAQKAMAENITYTGFIMLVIGLFLWRKRKLD